jgi:hypothetical protein
MYKHEDTVVHAQIKFYIWEQNIYQHCTYFPVKHYGSCFFFGFMLRTCIYKAFLFSVHMFRRCVPTEWGAVVCLQNVQ